MRRERFRAARLRACAAAACFTGLLVSSPCTGAVAGTGGEGIEDVESVHQAARARRDRADESRERLKRDREQKMRIWSEEQKALQEEADTLLKRHDVPSGDAVIDLVQEPGKPEEVVPAGRIVSPFVAVAEEYPSSHRDGIIKHEPWSLRREDLRVWKPSRVKSERPLGALAPYVVRDMVRQTDRSVFRDVFLAIPFALTNSTDRELLLGPTMTLVSENLRFTPEVGGFIAQQDIQRTMFRDVSSLADLTGYVKSLPDGGMEAAQVIQAGETRYGVGIFPLPDRELDDMKLIVDGLNTTYRFDRRQKRVLMVDFRHPGDEYYPYREPIEFVGKEWEWMWMWYEEFKVSALDKFEIPTPTGARTKTLWSYQVTLTNSTREPQKLTIRDFNTVVPMALSVPHGVGDVTIDIEVGFADDGKSTIDKAKVMEELALPFQGDRFFSGDLEPEEVKVFPVIFDQEDVLWERVVEQVERGLIDCEQGFALGYAEEPLKKGMDSWLPDEADLKALLSKAEKVRLNEERKAEIKKRVNAGLAEAVARQRKRFTLTADVTAECDLASGTYRVIRSYFRRGVVEPDWIHKWEE